jgi:hypothetical protein
MPDRPITGAAGSGGKQTSPLGGAMPKFVVAPAVLPLLTFGAPAADSSPPYVSPRPATGTCSRLARHLGLGCRLGHGLASGVAVPRMNRLICGYVPVGALSQVTFSPSLPAGVLHGAGPRGT